ncbi:excinuclease ATPase subunit [Nitrincola sp. MINF-07-Sa-05]|uniref:excinuclease ATPase subunit n=1 Tax=Nitrincola salilacus TaxID=3400273 RepID=UPI0039181D1B
MRKMLKLAIISSLLICGTAQARDQVIDLPLDQIMGTPKANGALLSVPVYFAGQSHPAVTSSGGEISTSKKTNAFAKSDSDACQWVLLSALKALQDTARQRGYDAVVNIRSNYKHNEFVSSTHYQCGAGAIMAGVALKGDMVKF